jgi:hypothetical protein
MVHVPDFKGKDAKVYDFPSETRAGVVHQVTVSKSGARCTCEGWQYRQSCKHVMEVPAYGAG